MHAVLRSDTGEEKIAEMTSPDSKLPGSARCPEKKPNGLDLGSLSVGLGATKGA